MSTCWAVTFGDFHLILVLKTEGHLRLRARLAAGRLWSLVAIATVLAIPATVLARPDWLHNYHEHPVAFLPIGVAVSLVCIVIALRKRSELDAFVSSCVYLIAILCGAAADLYPVLLPFTTPAMASITLQVLSRGP